MIEKIARVSLIALCVASIAGCWGPDPDNPKAEGSWTLAFCRSLGWCARPSPYVSWQEEVKINDGRVIVVDQKKRKGGLMAREAWLTFNLPEFSPQPILWHENLSPLILNISGGKLYIIGYPPTVVECTHYGKPDPSYVGFVWDGGNWVSIPFEQIPNNIYDTNMLIEGFPPYGTKLLVLTQKASREVNGAVGMPPALLHLSSTAHFCVR